MTSKMLLEQYMAERHALGFGLKTDEGCIRRFLRDFAEPDDGVLSFTKEYVLNHIGNRLNVQTNTILRDVIMRRSPEDTQTPGSISVCSMRRCRKVCAGCWTNWTPKKS